MDALSEILGSFGISGTMLSRASFGTPWAVHTDARSDAIFHVVVRGRAHVQRDGDDVAHPLRTGDVALLPHGHGHVMSSDPELPPLAVADIPAEDSDGSIATIDYAGRAGGDGREQCTVLCGTIRFEDELGHPLIALLPDLIHLRGGALAGWVDGTVDMLAAETSAGLPGSDVLMTKLAEMLFVQVLRGYIAGLEEEEGPRGWIAGLRDPRVARALALIHGQPAQRWTVATLATRVGMSRSGLFSRFTELVGEPPATYLTAWRMHIAKGRLRDEQLHLAELAEDVGYASEGAFSKAFKRTVGVTPSEYRFSQRAAR